MKREPWQSPAGRFQDVYKAEVERELAKLDQRVLDAFLRLVDYRLFLLGPQALVHPDRAPELSGAASELTSLAATLRALHDARIPTEKKVEENDDADG